jgi:hypothetical protein
MGLSRSTFYERPVSAPDDVAIVEALAAICEEFENFGWRRGSRRAAPSRRDRQPQKDPAPDARAWSSAEKPPTLSRNDRQRS